MAVVVVCYFIRGIIAYHGNIIPPCIFSFIEQNIDPCITRIVFVRTYVNLSPNFRIDSNPLHASAPPSSASSSYSSPPWLGAVKFFAPTILRLPHHISLITAPSLRWSLAMGLSYSKTVIYFSSLRQI
jgi:hypothetical protein